MFGAAPGGGGGGGVGVGVWWGGVSQSKSALLPLPYGLSGSPLSSSSFPEPHSHRKQIHRKQEC